MAINLSLQTEEMTEWRHHLHRNPELSYQEHATAAFVARKLREFGFRDIETDVGGTGVVGTLRNGTSARAIGVRADMDALPISEQTGVAHQSQSAGVMHACGHDGHTTMLLGAAKYLADTRRFDGTVHFVFQPAEEGLGDPSVAGAGEAAGGARAMIQDGLFERFPMDAIFGIHNRPGIASGKMGGRPGVLYAAADQFEITVRGRGGHAARPHLTVDPVLVASQIVVALQSVVARMLNPAACGVLSVCQFEAGTAFNVIPDSALLRGTVRTLEPASQDTIESAILAICTGVAAGFGAVADVRYMRGYPSLHNEPELYAKVREISASFLGDGNFVDLDEPTMGGEDFAWYLKEKPGCFLLIGNGDQGRGSVPLHNSSYDFNDEVAPIGAAYWSTLVEKLLPVDQNAST